MPRSLGALVTVSAALASLFACTSAGAPATAVLPDHPAKPAADKTSGGLIGIEPADLPDGAEATAGLSVPTATSASDPACRASARGFAQPLAVVEDLGLDRYPPLIGLPIPFGREADIHDLSGFVATTLDGRALETQAEVLSRWGDAPSVCAAPIRWGYVFALADAPPKRRAYLALRRDPSVSFQDPGPRLEVRESATEIVVDTGPARFTLDRAAFDGLGKVEVRTEDGYRNVLEDTSAAGGLFVERSGVLASPRHGRRLGLEVERRGPVLATIAVRGTYATPAKEDVFRYTVRLHFYAGTAAVQVDHTYYNGETADETAHGGRNRLLTDRVFLRLPLALGAAPEVTLRGAARLHAFQPAHPVAVLQNKRSPEVREVSYSITHGKEVLERGGFADLPMLGATGDGLYAVATLGLMGPRDPEGLRFDPKTGMLDVDFQSEPLWVGGARGVWAKAVLDFGEAGTVDLGRRGEQLHAHAARPLVGAPSVEYLSTTRAHGTLPGALPEALQGFDRDVDTIHARTADYLRRYRITGTQIWPDLPRSACQGAACNALASSYFEGGDDNYWDWSLVELDEFLRTADPSFLHDFALPEAITMAETMSFRPNPFSRSWRSSFGGFSPCYGAPKGKDGEWLEGLNHRLGSCPGDYSYNKVHELAYLLTADRRFLDFFTDGAETAIRMYKSPPKTRADTWLELSASRTTSQYLELLLDAAELTRDTAKSRSYRDRAIGYFEHMRTRALERGHTCNLLGSGEDDPKSLGTCTSDQAWMLPPWIEWVSRLAALYDLSSARAWLVEFAKTNPARQTVLDARGRPDIAQLEGGDGWRTVYACKATRRGIDDKSCRRVTNLENEGRFYPNGLVAYLNALALVRDVDPEDQADLCAWLPAAYTQALAGMKDQTNGYVWGKELGQAYAFTQRALGALEGCRAVRER